jgi:hypothetical protein
MLTKCSILVQIRIDFDEEYGWPLGNSSVSGNCPLVRLALMWFARIRLNFSSYFFQSFAETSSSPFTDLLLSPLIMLLTSPCVIGPRVNGVVVS